MLHAYSEEMGTIFILRFEFGIIQLQVLALVAGVLLEKQLVVVCPNLVSWPVKYVSSPLTCEYS